MFENNENFARERKCPIFKGCFPIVVGPTGATGPTERLFKSSNKIIIDSS